jgi:hypothetical protein
LNLEVTELVRNRMDRIQELTEADSITEVVRRSLTVYEILLSQKGQLVLVDSEGVERDLILV